MDFLIRDFYYQILNTVLNLLLKLSIECSIRSKCRDEIEIWTYYVIYNLVISSCSKQLHIKGFICLYVCPSVHVTAFFWHVSIIGFSWNLQKTSGWKVKGHTNCLKFLSCLLHGSARIWLIPFIFCTNITYEMIMCHAQFPGQKAEDQGHTGSSKLRSRVVRSFCHVCSVTLCLFDRFVLYRWVNARKT